MALPKNSEREGLLSATVQSALKLLHAHDLEQAVPEILDALGRATEADRIHLVEMKRGESGEVDRCVPRFSWCAPGIAPTRRMNGIEQRDLNTEGFGEWLARLLAGEIVSQTVSELPEKVRSFFEADNVGSVVAVPIFTDEEWWGCIGFETCRERHESLSEENDALRMLAEVVGVAVQRARTSSELADAQRIIESSSTLLFRLTPHAPDKFRLIYISSNIERYGFAAEALMAHPDAWVDLIERADLAKVMKGLKNSSCDDAASAELEFRLIRPNGIRTWFSGRAKRLRDPRTGMEIIEGLLSDITEQKLSALELERMALTDGMTGLANRTAFMKKLTDAVEGETKKAGLLAVHFIDLDRFKQVNDSYGHATGDDLLRAVAWRLRRSVRDVDLVARFGGDEFAVLQLDVPSLEDARSTSERISELAGRIYWLGGYEIEIGASVGLACDEARLSDASVLMASADAALYRAKAEGRSCVRVFDPALDRLPAGPDRVRKRALPAA